MSMDQMPMKKPHPNGSYYFPFKKGGGVLQFQRESIDGRAKLKIP